MNRFSDVQLYLYEKKLPTGGHGAMMETSKMQDARAEMIS